MRSRGSHPVVVVAVVDAEADPEARLVFAFQGHAGAGPSCSRTSSSTRRRKARSGRGSMLIVLLGGIDADAFAVGQVAQQFAAGFRAGREISARA
jgi:hypothetical protein